MDHKDDTGRFSPSCVFSRWKWAVRFGLLIVPALVLLAGGLTLYFTPNKYESKTLVEIENSRNPSESASLLESSEILGRVIEHLGLVDRWSADKSTAESILRGITRIRVIPETRLIEIAVIHAQKELSRDIALELPRSLADFEKSRIREAVAAKIANLDQLIQDASDTAAEKTVAATKIEKFHGGQPPDESALRELERARRASLVADAEVERLQVLRADAASAAAESEPRLVVHTAPQISNNPVNPKFGPELDELAVRSLVSGLLVALLLPYLLELALPCRDDREIMPYLVEDL